MMRDIWDGGDNVYDGHDDVVTINNRNEFTLILNLFLQMVFRATCVKKIRLVLIQTAWINLMLTPIAM